MTAAVLLGIGLCPILAVCVYVCATTYSKPGSQLREEVNVLKIATAVLAIVILLLLSSVNFAAVPISPPLTDTVALIEINHLHRTDGCHTFTQVIFWEWDRNYSRHQIVAWRMMHDTADWPIDKSPCGKWRVTWREGGVLRRVMAGRLRETRTVIDPEVAEREILPREFRRGLSPAKSSPK